MKTIRIEPINIKTSQENTYGFIAFHDGGKSLPKGMYSSFVARQHKASQKTQIEFSIQSPTGDSSDHHNYTYPCVSFEQAKIIVDTHSKMMKSLIMEEQTV